MRIFKFVLVFLFVLIPALAASAQPINRSNGPRIIACPAGQIPPQNRGMKRWNFDHVANYPVIPELFGGDPYMVNRYVNGPTERDSPEDRAKLQKGHDNLMTVLSYELFTPQNTDIRVAAKTPPQSFLNDYAAASVPDKLKWRIAPCGETVLDNLSWYEEGKGIVVDNEPTVVNWCEEGVLTADGKCGFRVVETEPILLREGPYQDWMASIMIVLRCGNPSTHQLRPPAAPPTIVRAEPPPASPVATPPPPAPVPPAPAPAPVAQEPPAPKLPESVSDEGGMIIAGSIGYAFGSVHTDYLYPDPKRGDVPQKHNFASPVIILRVDQSARSGIFAEGAFTILGTTSAMLFEDLSGSWITKKRDTDSSRDQTIDLKAGYKFPLGDLLSIGASVNFNRLDLGETYFAQNTNTENHRIFQTVGIGVEAAGANHSEHHKLTVRAIGMFGISGHRDKWTTQVYQGPPVINFPKVTDDTQEAKLNRLSAEVEAGVVPHVGIFANASYSSWDSSRPTSNPATTETTTMKKFVVGVKLTF